MRETPFELQNKKQLLRTFYEAVNNGIIVIEPSGKMIFANTIACSLLGLAEVEIEDRFFITCLLM
ncbi:PAS domain S-box protein [Fictibacillus barbaricus]|uniref:PAS domain S-box protein n=1 Tax=Fictibacillus barbaricus TaxID=182136 RepID=A0ABS2ZI96_9BACL|nr:PAS domain-containing protein [Fictibacillus barbaricus]MBN3547142.1 PAS domain S-box protein [Fictibacillus barbaricus]